MVDERAGTTALLLATVQRGWQPSNRQSQIERCTIIGRELFETGLATRREVLGREYVDEGLAASDEFMMAFQEAVSSIAWGYSWSRDGLDRRSRMILTLGILAGLGRHQELGIYAQGAVRNGVTVDEIKEILVHVTSYCGTPAGRESFLAVHEALVECGAIPSK